MKLFCYRMIICVKDIQLYYVITRQYFHYIKIIAQGEINIGSCTQQADYQACIEQLWHNIKRKWCQCYYHVILDLQYLQQYKTAIPDVELLACEKYIFIQKLLAKQLAVKIPLAFDYIEQKAPIIQPNLKNTLTIYYCDKQYIDNWIGLLGKRNVVFIGVPYDLLIPLDDVVSVDSHQHHIKAQLLNYAKLPILSGINLLPWRLKHITYLRKRFILSFMLSLFATLCCGVGYLHYLHRQISEAQQESQRFAIIYTEQQQLLISRIELSQQIQLLQNQHHDWMTKKERLIYLDALLVFFTKSLPNTIWLTAIDIQAQIILVDGVSLSNLAITTLQQQLLSLPFIVHCKINVIKYQQQKYQYQLAISLVIQS